MICVLCGKTLSEHHYSALYCYGTSDSESYNQVFTIPSPPTGRTEEK